MSSDVLRSSHSTPVHMIAGSAADLKVAVITANVGRFDNALSHPRQIRKCQFVFYNETNLPDEVSGMSNRMKSKYPKMQAHKLLPDFDVYIWLDARVLIRSPRFAENYLRMLTECDLVATTHPDRKCLTEEYQFMIRKIEGGDAYLRQRYLVEDLKQQLQYIRLCDFPVYEFPLFSAGISARWNIPKVNDMMDEWWELSRIAGEYDQGFYSFLIWKHRLNWRTVNFHNPFFKVMPRP